MGRKLFLAVILLCCLTAGIFAQGFFLGLGAEASAYTREGAAVGGSLVLGINLNSYFTTGIRASFFHNMDTLKAIDPVVFFRYYPSSYLGLYLQAEGGYAILLEMGEIFPVISGGLTAGWRFYLGEGWFIEPSGRFGYPYMWGAGLTAGYNFKNN